MSDSDANPDASPDPAVVSLDDVISEMDLQTEESAVYLDRRTGELIVVTEEEMRLAEKTVGLVDDDEQEEEWDRLPDWQAEVLPKAREVLASDHFLPLPSRFEIHEWRIMERFALQVEDDAMRDTLLDALHGRGAFRRFKDAVHRLGIADAWYRYRDAALEELAVDWLEANGIRFRRGRVASPDEPE